MTQIQKGGLSTLGKGATYWTVQLPCKPQVRVAWDISHPTPSLQPDAGPADSKSCHCLTFPPEPLESQVIRPMSKGPLLHSPQPQERSSLACPTCIRGTYPRHVLHEDGQSLLGTVPQAAIVLHYALVLQVLQQLDLTLQCTHLLGERPSGHLGFQGPGSTCLGSAQLALVSGLRGVCLPWELQLEKRGDSLNCLALVHNAG